MNILSCAQKKDQQQAKPEVMNQKPIIGIIGSGHVGGTLGKKWAKAGYKALFSSRNPEQLKDLITEAGQGSEAVTVTDAAKRADIIVLAMPYKAEATISKQIMPYIKGKTLLERR